MIIKYSSFFILHSSYSNDSFYFTERLSFGKRDSYIIHSRQITKKRSIMLRVIPFPWNTSLAVILHNPGKTQHVSRHQHTRSNNRILSFHYSFLLNEYILLTNSFNGYSIKRLNSHFLGIIIIFPRWFTIIHLISNSLVATSK